MLIYKPTLSMFIKTWIVERLERLHGRLYRYLVDDITADFEKKALLYALKIKRSHSLSPAQAQYKLINLKPVLRSYERLDTHVSEIENYRIKNSFKELKKNLFKYEAKLHRVATSKVPVEETPEYIKSMLSSLNKRIVV